jgi:DNA-binding GntR family transcriptional regulator
VLAIRRVKLLGGVRAGYSVDYVPAGALPFETLRGEHAGSTLDVFLAHGEPQVDHADTELAPIRLPREVAQRLGVRTGTSGLLLDMVVKTAEGRAVAWSAAWLLPDHFRFVLRRRLPIGR